MTRTTDPLLRGLESRRQALSAEGPAWLQEVRGRARTRLDDVGFPNVRQEAWRNTNVAPILRTEFRTAEQPAVPRELPELAALELGGPRLVFIDGRFAADRSSAVVDGDLWIGSLRDALEQVPDRVREHLAEEQEAAAFEALNGAFLDDGAVVLVPAGRDLEQPVQLLFLSGGADAPTVSQPRLLIVAERDSRVRIVELHAGARDSEYFTNAVSRVFVGDNATVERTRVQLESEKAYHVSTEFSRQGRDSRYVSRGFDFGGKLVRHDMRSVLDGEGGHCRLDGLYLTRNEQHVDNHTVLDHAQPNCDSRELFKGILAGKSRSVFSGRIIVRQDAQKTDAKQSNPNLLLSPTSLAHTQPQLEIYADDVKCTHGATVGRMDENAIYYLRTRGIPEREARNMMIRAYAGEVLEQVEIDALREALEKEVDARLPRAQD